MLVGGIPYIAQVQSFATNVARSVFLCLRDQTYVGPLARPGEYD